MIHAPYILAQPALPQHGLWTYFGFVGVASIVFWLAAVAILAAFCRHRWRTRMYLAAIGCAVVALALARINSAAVSDIQVDRSEEIRQMQEKQARRRRELLEQRRRQTAGIRFAEDAPTDALDLAGVEDAEKREKLTEATTQADTRPAYLYRQRGKQRRDPSRASTRPTDVGLADTVEEARTLPLPDVIRADRYDRMNLFAARWTLIAAVGLLILDYLLRFNRTFDTLLPVPVGGRAIDSHFRKTRAVAVPPGSTETLAELLRRVVRKGETFVYFGPDEPLTDRFPSRLPGGLWPVETLTFRPDSPPYSREMLFESAWFARNNAVVLGAELGRDVLADMVERMKRRRQRQAAARRTVHLVWNHDEPVGDELLGDLLREVPSVNFKLVVTTARPGAVDGFDEIHTTPPGFRGI